MRENERINRIAGLITQIWEQHDKSFLQLIEILKSEYISQQTIIKKKRVSITLMTKNLRGFLKST